MGAITTLAAAVSASDTSIQVVDASDFSLPLLIQIGRETMQVGDGPPASATWPVIRSLSSQNTVLFFDDFADRESADDWEAAGKPWKHAETLPLFWTNAVSGGLGIVTLLDVSSVVQPTLLTPDKYADTELRMRFTIDRMPSGGDTEVSLFIRDQNSSPNNRYLGRLLISTAGVVTTRIRKIVAGTGTSLGSNVVAPGTFAAGEWWNVAMQAVGFNPTTLQMKAWRDVDAEPSWQNTLTDSDAALQLVGYQGCRFQVDPTNTNLPSFNVDSYRVATVAVGYAHAIGDAVVAVDQSWPGPINVWGRGAPTFPAPTGSVYLDVDNDRVYWRVGATWKYVTLT